jgi:hypothetical protein
VLYARVTTTQGVFSTTATLQEGRMAYNLPNGMQVGVTVAYVDQAGNPAVVDGAVTWTSSDDMIASVSATGNTSATIMAGADLGVAQITANADADLGSGVRSLLTLMDVTVVAGEAVSGTITPDGPPVPIP